LPPVISLTFSKKPRLRSVSIAQFTALYGESPHGLTLERTVATVRGVDPRERELFRKVKGGAPTS
jgi:hypothetical protein